jgi:hypothetical protein
MALNVKSSFKINFDRYFCKFLARMTLSHRSYRCSPHSSTFCAYFIIFHIFFSIFSILKKSFSKTRFFPVNRFSPQPRVVEQLHCPGLFQRITRLLWLRDRDLSLSLLSLFRGGLSWLRTVAARCRMNEFVGNNERVSEMCYN